MNQDQKRYTLNRIREILNDKIKKVREKYKVDEEELTGKEIISLIKSGKAKLKKVLSQVNEYDKVYEVFDLELFKKVPDCSKLDAALLKLDTYADKLKDEVMLGDQAEAIKLLANFVKLEV